MRKVLVVDDDHLVRKGFIGMMPWNKYGFEVVGEAGNGEKALSLLEQMQVDLLITDLAMPVMSGLELMKRVKEQYPKTELVVLSFHHDFKWIQEAMRLGAVDYITKVELEHEQMDDVLRRIGSRMDETAAPGTLPAGDPGDGIGSDEDLPYSREVVQCIRKAVALIRETFQSEVLLPEVARKVNMSRSYFSRCFKDITGKTFNDFVREVRIDHAKKLLQQTAKPVQWIAVQSGYPNEKYFFKVFREMTGMHPGEFRKTERNRRVGFQIGAEP